MWILRTLALILVVVVVLGFVVYNHSLDQRVTIDLYWKLFEDVSLLVALFWAFLSGLVISLLMFMGVYIRQLAQLSMARRSIRGLNEELAALRNRPIEDSADLFSEPATSHSADRPN